MARDRELGRLRVAFDQAAAGSAAAVLISGDAGVGKTRLTDELASIARDKDAVVLTGRCLDDGETGLPYLPFVEAMGQVPDRAQAVLAHPALVRLFPDAILPTGERPGGGGMVGVGAVVAGAGARTGNRSEQDVGQLQLFDAVHALLTDLAAASAVLLVLEDLHWADGSTRRLLAFLVSRLREQRLLIVGTYRGDDLHRRHPCGRCWPSSSGCRPPSGSISARSTRPTPARSSPRSPRSCCRRKPSERWPAARRATRSSPRSCSPPTARAVPVACRGRSSTCCWPRWSGSPTAHSG
ncbi:AAA family ATPase [Actinophytocola sp.]|uniref:AAA family ATPase n=1 Tax=Actinophytocola sp. TaxID=1872138 RepID=UPI00345BD288